MILIGGYFGEGLLNTVETANKKLVDLLERSAESISKNGGKFTKLPATLFDKKAAEIAVNDLVRNMNTKEFSQPMRELAQAFIGRTDDNGNVYDLIKMVRTTVARARQGFITDVPKLLRSKLKTLTDNDHAMLYHLMGKTDLSSLSMTRAMDVLTGSVNLSSELKNLELRIKSLDHKNADYILRKSDQLANYMVTGVTGNMLNRNAHSIARLAGTASVRKEHPKSLVKLIDEYVTLKAYSSYPVEMQQQVKDIVKNNKQGILNLFNYIKSIKLYEQDKINAYQLSTDNYFKGYLPDVAVGSKVLIIADKKDYSKLIRQGYSFAGDYQNSEADLYGGNKAYFVRRMPIHKQFQQGILQNVRPTVGGISVDTGASTGISGGLIYDPVEVRKITVRAGSKDTSNLLPIFDKNGNIKGYERVASSKMLDAHLSFEKSLPEILGIYRGRQHEELAGESANEISLVELKKMYDRDVKLGRGDEYVNLFAPTTDPIIKDAITIISERTGDAIKDVWGDSFYVRKDLLHDVIGYRSASVVDSWTGISKFSEDTQKSIKKYAYLFLGNKAINTLESAENILEGSVTLAKHNIVVRSLVVVLSNIVSNLVHLLMVGTRIKSFKLIPKIIAELEQYEAGTKRLIEIDSEISVLKASAKADFDKLNAEANSIRDSFTYFSIFPLIERGELSSITDVGQKRNSDIYGKDLGDYIENTISKIPDKSLASLANNLVLTSSSPLYGALEKMTVYGDFVAKAVLYHDLADKGVNKADRLKRITDEFVNYDRLSGRFREKLESLGLLWFMNYKLRATKVGLSVLRNNPLQALLLSLSVPNVDTPLNSDILGTMVDGSISYAVGTDMLVSGLTTNPYLMLVE